MNNLIMYIGIYVLIVLAVFLTVGLAWFLIVGRAVAQRKKMWDDEWEAMHQRIKRRKELNGKSTDHKIDLERFNNGGWTGEVSGKEHIDLKLNEPHPYYAREVRDE